MGPRLRNFVLGLALAFAATTVVGCKVTNEDIETWKGTVKGPGKLVAVLLADKFELPLRVSAAYALVEMDRQDVDGVAELQRALTQLDGQTRSAIVTALAPRLIKLMNASDGDSDQGPPVTQVRAKDAAFTLIAHAPPDVRKELTSAVVRWYTVDFNGRNLSGNYSAEQVVRQLGSSAATVLIEALDAKLPQQALVKLAELIGQLGDQATKTAAAAKLVAIEREMRSDAFLDWLKSQIEGQLKAAGQEASSERVAKAAALNRDKFIDEGLIPAMKYLADQPQIANRLLAIASDGNETAERRARALQALEGHAREAHLEALLSLALDPKAPTLVRDYAFDRVGDVRSEKALSPMWPLVEDKVNQRLRWRAGELVLAIGGNSVLAEFLEKLPVEDAAYEPEELEGYATRMGQMTPLPTDVLAAQLESPDWFDRVIALDFFERKGSASDIPRMSRLLGDTTPVKGKNWGSTDTVGKVAKQAIDGLRERLGHAQGEAADATP